jgi:hypothetical protein
VVVFGDMTPEQFKRLQDAMNIGSTAEILDEYTDGSVKGKTYIWDGAKWQRQPNKG